MTDIKQATRFGTRTKMVIVAAFAVSFLLMVMLVRWLPSGIVLFVTFILCALGIALVITWQLGRFVCPDCGGAAPLEDVEGRTGCPIRYHCRKCNVSWDTGLRTMDDQ